MAQPQPDSAPSTTSSTAFKASTYAHDKKKHLLLASSGSVATIKLPLILHSLSSHPSLSIRLLLTPTAVSFLRGQSAEQPALASLLSIPNVDAIHLDADEWAVPWERGHPILHIELRRWADVLLIAPLSAGMMAKICAGWAEGLLPCIVRAWDTTGAVEGRVKRIVVAPAMNTGMWRQPVTARQIRTLEEEWGVSGGDTRTLGGEAEGWFEVLRPQEKELACGDVGDGAMIAWEKIVAVIEERLELRRVED